MSESTVVEDYYGTTHELILQALNDLKTNMTAHIQSVETRLSGIETRVDRLVESNKNLIKYFESIHHELMARESNLASRLFMFNRSANQI